MVTINKAYIKVNNEKEQKRLGLDKPIYVQYGLWAKAFIKGDLGYTSSGEKVSQKLAEVLHKRNYGNVEVVTEK